MTKKHLSWRVAALCVVAALMVAAVPAPAVADSASSLRAQKEELEQRISELENEKNLLSDDLDDKKQRQSVIEEQIGLKEQEIAVNNNLIDALDNELYENSTAITAREQAIAAREQAIADRFATLQERLRLVAKTGNMSTLQMLFDTDDYVDYLIKSKILEKIAANDQQLIHEMEAEIADINGEKKVLESDRTTLNSRKEELLEIKAAADEDRSELENLYTEAHEAVVDIQDNMDSIDSEIAYTQEQAEALEAEIQDILRRAAYSSSQTYHGGSMYWPSSTCTMITDTFGWRILDGSSNFHGGIDIVCPGSAYGQDILAAEDGTVIYVNASDSWGSGWGYYVIVDHGLDAAGCRITTLYAHCSAIYVSEGQEVTGGSTCLGAIGNTGWSYGSHLHFEVREDGERVDPLGCGYVSPP